METGAHPKAPVFFARNGPIHYVSMCRSGMDGRTRTVWIEDIEYEPILSAPPDRGAAWMAGPQGREVL